MGDQHRGRRGRGGDRLSPRRPQDDNDTLYDNPDCPYESVEAEPQSEHETSGEWNAAGVDEEDTRQFPQAQGAAGLSEELPVDPIKDEWSAFIAAGRAEEAADAAQSAFGAAKEAERLAKVAREADWPNATQLAQLAYSASQRSVAANLFAKRAADAAKQAAEAAKLAAKIQEKPILKVMWTKNDDPASRSMVINRRMSYTTRK